MPSGELDKCKVNVSYSKYIFFTRTSIDFVLAFPKSDLDIDVFTELPLGMGVDGKIRLWTKERNQVQIVLIF